VIELSCKHVSAVELLHKRKGTVELSCKHERAVELLRKRKGAVELSRKRERVIPSYIVPDVRGFWYYKIRLLTKRNL